MFTISCSTVDELVSLAIIASLVRGEFLAAAVVSFVMVMGALIEQANSDSARKAIKSLVDISPVTATVIAEDHVETVPLSKVRAGDLLLVKPGERIPVDGVIQKGRTAVDESSMTGEPIPVEKSMGDPVSSGTLNQNGVIEIEATRVGEDTTLSKIIKLVSEAEQHKPKAIRLIDRYARWFTPAILASSGVTWWLTGDVSRAIALLIVGCSCALILATPTAIVATIGRANHQVEYRFRHGFQSGGRPRQWHRTTQSHHGSHCSQHWLCPCGDFIGKHGLCSRNQRSTRLRCCPQQEDRRITMLFPPTSHRHRDISLASFE